MDMLHNFLLRMRPLWWWWHPPDLGFWLDKIASLRTSLFSRGKLCSLFCVVRMKALSPSFMGLLQPNQWKLQEEKQSKKKLWLFVPGYVSCVCTVCISQYTGFAVLCKYVQCAYMHQYICTLISIFWYGYVELVFFRWNSNDLKQIRFHLTQIFFYFSE